MLGDSASGADGLRRCCSRRSGDHKPVEIHRGSVESVEDTAQHGDAQRPAELASRVVDGRADAGLGCWHCAHDAGGRRRAGEADAGPEEHEGRGEHEVGRARLHERQDGVTPSGDPETGGDDDAAAEALGQRCTSDRARDQGERRRKRRQTGHER